MSYKNKTNTKVECPVYIGAGHRCPIMNEECIYTNKLMDCSSYQTHFMSDKERIKIEKRGLAIVVDMLGLRKLSRIDNGKFKK